MFMYVPARSSSGRLYCSSQLGGSSFPLGLVYEEELLMLDGVCSSGGHTTQLVEERLYSYNWRFLTS